MSHTYLLHILRNAIMATVVIFAFSILSFLAFEPSLGRAVSDDFTVTQQITGEISFLVAPADVMMVGSIAGLTGGYATGTTRVAVRTNNPTGYKMTLAFATTTSGQAMTASSTAYINNYSTAVANFPDLLWQDNPGGGAAEFGYTVMASTTGEVDPSFRNDGSTCNTSTLETVDRCWMTPSTTPEVIINSSAPTVSSTTTIKFKVAVPNAPNPALPAAFYVATGTLTATNNP